MKLIYQKISSWETEFITTDIFNGTEIIFKSCEDLIDKSTYSDDLINNCIFVFTSNRNSYDDIRNVVEYLKPLIIVHMSDEFGSRSEYQNLAKYTPLLLRQYNIKDYPTFENIHYFPLGYHTGFQHKSVIKRASERKYTFSFVGDIKNKDGQKMIDKMSVLSPNYIHLSSWNSNKLNPFDIKDIYLDSIFVPSRRGYIRLDCFRIYEALECGAIPIIVGSSEEIRDAFKFNVFPPWLFCDSWKDARRQCEKLIKESKVDQLQKENYKWWTQTKEYYRNLIQQFVPLG